MQKKLFRPMLGFSVIIVLILILVGCNLPGSLPQNVDEIVAQTLTALSAQVITPMVEIITPQQTTGTEISTPMTPPKNTPLPVTHLIMPGEMQAIESTVDDVIYNSDDFSSNLYERPFTETVMDDRFDLDLQKIGMSTDNTFFYFSLDLKDVNVGSKTLDGNYGIELDMDKDGRGDYLLWAYQPPVSSAWDYQGIALFSDINKDVGGTHALLSDPINPNWNGYENEIWPSESLTDPDGAWMRISPSDATVVQLAVKRSLVGNPSLFLWGAWADDQIKAPDKFDYHDFYTAAEAGSPHPNNPNYPLKALSQMDNTCREAWGFKPTGNEPGICKKTTAVQSTSKPKTTTKPGVTPTKTPTGPTNTPMTPTNTPFVPSYTPTTKVITPTYTPTTCSDVQIGAQVTPWDVAYTSGVTLCLDGGDCMNPDASGYVIWYRPAGIYTITASSGYGISPASVTVKLGCGEKSLDQFALGPG